jgi:hypothetical protein
MSPFSGYHEPAVSFLNGVTSQKTVIKSYSLTSDLFLFFYSCCSNLEHRASVKRFVSSQFLNLRHWLVLIGWGISPS